MFDYIRFEVYSGLYKDFFNYIIESGFYIRNVKSTDFGFSAECSAHNYLLFARKARRYQCKIRVKKRLGIVFKIKKLKKRKGLIYGTFLCLMLLYAFNGIIWKININIDDTMLKNNIANVLCENGIYTGAFYSEEKLREMKKNLIQYDAEIGYAALNFYKGTLNCEIYPRIKTEKYMSAGKDGDITAQIGGVIEDLRIYDGYSELKIGQSVSKGETLVMAVNPITMKYTPTRAYIAAICNKDYIVTVPFEKNAEIYTGRTAKQKNIYFLNFKFHFQDDDLKDFGSYSEQKTLEYYNFFGFYLPVTVEKFFCAETKNVSLKNDMFSAQDMAKHHIEMQIIDDEKLVEEYSREYIYEIGENSIKTICRVSCLYDIT